MCVYCLRFHLGAALHSFSALPHSEIGIVEAMTAPTTGTLAPENPFSDAMNTSTGSLGMEEVSSDAPASNGHMNGTTVPSNSEDETVLIVDRNATLTLGTDALVLLDEGLLSNQDRSATNCCGLLPHHYHPFAKTTRAIPFYNILWAELGEDLDLSIQYAAPAGRKKKACTVRTMEYSVIDKSLAAHARRWVEKLLDRAYPSPAMKRRKRVKVLINPFGGQGYAQTLWTREVEPVFAAAKCDVSVERTGYRGHAIEIAEGLDVDAWDVVACASGDGLPHEVWNGLAKQSDPRRALRKVAVVQIPCGSGNALSLNFNGTDSPSWAALAIVKGVRAKFDLTAITQGDATYYSFLSQAVGLIADSDLGTESLRWMGPLRFTWGALVRIMSKSIYPAEISVAVESADKDTIKSEYRRRVSEHKASIDKNLALASTREDHDDSLLDQTQPTLPPLRYGTIRDLQPPRTFHTEDLPTLGNFFVGNMCYMSPDNAFFPASLPSDGRMDMVAISGQTKRSRSLAMLLSVADGGIMDFPEVSYRKVSAYRITPRLYRPEKKGRFGLKLAKWLGGGAKQAQGLIAIDGESVPFEPFQAEVVPGVATVLCKRPGLYEFEFAK